MATDIGFRVGLDGAAQFRSDLRLITQQSKELAAEMKAVAASFTTASSSQQKLAATAETLQKQISNQKQRLDLLNTAYTEGKSKLDALRASILQAQQQYGASSKEVDRAIRAYDDQAISVSKTKTELNKTTAALRTMEDQLADTNKKMEAGESATNDLSDSLDDAKKSAADFGDVLKANVVADVIVSGLKEMARAAVDLAKSLASTGVSYAAQMEKIEQNFSTLLQSEKQGKALMQEVQEYAQKTSFDTPGLAEAAQNLLAVGYSGEEVMPTLRMLGDVSLGDSEKMSRLALAMSQISSAGKLNAQDLNQLVNAGFNPLQVISEQTGKSMAVLREEMSDGAITADMVADALESVTSEGGRFYKAVEKGAQTTQGKWENLQEVFSATLGSIAKSAMPLINSVLDMLSVLVEEINTQVVPAMRNFFEGVDAEAFAQQLYVLIHTIIDNAPAILSVLTGISSAIAAAKFSEVIAKVTAGIKGLLATGSGIGIIAGGWVTIIIGAVAALVTLWNTSEGFRNFVTGAAQAITEAVTSAAKAIDTWFLNVAADIAAAITNCLTFVGQIVDAISQYLQFFSNSWKQIFDFVNNAFDNFRNSAIQKARDAGQGIINGVGAAVDWLKNLPAQAMKWGSDMIDGFVSGITSGIGKITSAIKDVASAISRNLHFSRPDEGPLRDYETWMPDMIAGLAKGIRDNAYQLENAADYLASRLVIPQITAPAVQAAGAAAKAGPAGGAGPSVNITVYGAQGQDVNQLADIIMQKMEAAVNRKAGVWA